MLRNIPFIYLALLFILHTSASGQESYPFNNSLEHFEKAKEYYNLDLYGQARTSAQAYLQQHRDIQDQTPRQGVHLEAMSIYLIAGLQIQEPEAEEQLLDFVSSNEGNPLTFDGLFELGNFYYNEKRYDDAIKYFDKIDTDLLTEERMSELVFKKGYCHFVKKEFAKAQYEFSYSKDVKNKFFYPINYYNGMCEYFTGDYEDAVKAFQRVDGSSVYAKHIPYYISQIYFAEKKYDKLISYGERVILERDVKKVSQIRQLLGQTYFLRNDYERALPHLEHYEAETAELTVEEFYQLAFAQYKLGYYEKAIENFLEISREDSKLGQLVNYYLADSYVNIGDLTSARAAFKKVSQMSYDENMKEEATFNYGKVSSQLGFEREAINVLMEVRTNSAYYSETQSIINDILVNTSDYDNALGILEDIPNLNNQLKKTYQSITFKRAQQYLSEGKEEAAMDMLTKSETYDLDPNVSAQTSYWKGYITMSNEDHNASLNYFEKYFRQLKQAGTMPEEASEFMANYNQGYNHLKIEEYYFAVDQFQFAIDGINSNKSKIKDQAIIDRVLPDAYVRAGDCLFKEKRYKQSKKYYAGAITREKGDFVYALYQTALIEGLERDNYSKIVTLEQIINDHPESDYADDAIVQVGETYLSTGNPQPAASAFNKLITKYKGKSNLINRAYLKLGLITYNEGDAYKALDYYKKVFANNPNPQESQEAMLAIEEIYIDDLAKGQEFIAFLDSLPGYEVDAFARDSINYKVGENKFNEAKYDEAIAAFDIYLGRYDRGYYRLNAHYLRGESLSLGKSYSKALKDYEAIISEGISDYYERSLKKAAIISYNYTQNFNKALKYYTALEKQTNNPEEKFQAQLGAMRSAFRLGKDSQVVQYANLVNRNGLSSTAEKSAAMYYLGKTSYKNGQLAEAAIAFKQVAQLSTNNQAAESRYMLAQIYFDQGKSPEAETQVADANSKNGAYPYWIAKSLLLMSDIFVQRADLLNARAAVEAVLENFKDDQGLVDEAKKKLLLIAAEESDANRIRVENADGTLQLDTARN